MNKIKKFDTFLNESAINEDAKWYEDNGYITDPSVSNIEDLQKLVEDNIQPALDEFCKKNNIPELKFTGFKSIRNKPYIEVESKKFVGDELGIFKNCLEWAQLHFFNGGDLQGSTSKDAPDKYFFVPDVWCTLHLNYPGNGQDFNFCEVGGRGDNTMYYNILDKKWYDRNDMIKKHKEK